MRRIFLLLLLLSWPCFGAMRFTSGGIGVNCVSQNVPVPLTGNRVLLRGRVGGVGGEVSLFNAQGSLPTRQLRFFSNADGSASIYFGTTPPLASSRIDLPVGTLCKVDDIICMGADSTGRVVVAVNGQVVGDKVLPNSSVLFGVTTNRMQSTGSIGTLLDGLAMSRMDGVGDLGEVVAAQAAIQVLDPYSFDASWNFLFDENLASKSGVESGFSWPNTKWVPYVPPLPPDLIPMGFNLSDYILAFILAMGVLATACVGVFFAWWLVRKCLWWARGYE